MQTSHIERQALTDALEFIRGFEDDSNQHGITDLIGRIEAAVAAPGQQIVLQQPLPGAREMRYLSDSNYCLDLHPGPGNNTSWMRYHYGVRAGYWIGTIELLCQRGTGWHSDFTAVVDDFGNLVEVSR